MPDQAKRYDELMHGRATSAAAPRSSGLSFTSTRRWGSRTVSAGAWSSCSRARRRRPNVSVRLISGILMYQMTRLPEAKIKAILDEPQWRLLEPAVHAGPGHGARGSGATA